MKVKLFYLSLFTLFFQVSNIFCDYGANCDKTNTNWPQSGNKWLHQGPCPLQTSSNNTSYIGKPILSSRTNWNNGTTPVLASEGKPSLENGQSDIIMGVPASGFLGTRGNFLVLKPLPSEGNFAYGDPWSDYYEDGNPRYVWADPQQLVWSNISNNMTDMTKATYSPVSTISGQFNVTEFKVKNTLKVPVYVALYYSVGTQWDTTVGSDKFLRVPKFATNPDGTVKLSDPIYSVIQPGLKNSWSNIKVPYRTNVVSNDPKDPVAYTIAPGKTVDVSYSPMPNMVACRTFRDNYSAAWEACCDCIYTLSSTQTPQPVSPHNLYLVASTNKNFLNQSVLPKTSLTSTDYAATQVAASTGSSYTGVAGIPNVLTFTRDDGSGQLAWNLNAVAAPTPATSNQSSNQSSTGSTGDSSSDSSGSSSQSSSAPVSFTSQGGLPS